MKSLFVSYLRLVFAGILSLALLNCAPFEAEEAFKVAGSGLQGDLGSGTSDTGGGNGIDGRVFEAYIIDPTELPAYKSGVKPLLDNIQSIDEDEGDDTGHSLLFLTKTWYLAPVDLKTINKKTLGVEFFKNSTDQLAIQTKNEIWIDKRYFDKMSTDDQSRLLVHEFMMQLYTLRFLKFSEICRAHNAAMVGRTQKTNDDSCKNSAKLDRIMPAEATRPLNDEDYANIRFATGWFFKHAQKPISQKLFAEMLYSKGFDKRFFNPENYKSKNFTPEEVKLPKEDLEKLLRSAVLTGHTPNYCLAANTKKSGPCKLSISIEDHPNPIYKNAGSRQVVFEVTNSEGAKIKASSLIHDSTLSQMNHLPEANNVFVLGLIDIHHEKQVGDKVYYGYVFLDRQDLQSPLTLRSIVLIPYVIIQAQDTKKNKPCEAYLLQPKDYLSDSLVIYRQNKPGSLPASSLEMLLVQHENPKIECGYLDETKIPSQTPSESGENK